LGSIDWLCLPRFDAPACFAALLGAAENGCWSLGPEQPVRSSRQAYRSDTLILETSLQCAEGDVQIVDAMPTGQPHRRLIRKVGGIAGKVRMRTELRLAFDYGATRPWVRPTPDGVLAIAGPNAVLLRSAVSLRPTDDGAVAEFAISAGEEVSFELCWFPAHESPPAALDLQAALHATEMFWRDWVGRCHREGPWHKAVIRSLITVKALTYAPTGGVVAAATTSLPEKLGGVRNWDYRYCWLRDATLTLRALLHAGFTDEATQWGHWLLRAVAGDPADLQMLYGVAGERFLGEHELPHLRGYEGSRPVRIGNAATKQFQLDVYGEIMDATQLKRRLGLATSEDAWQVQRRLVNFVVEHWPKPDEGIWEVRGPRRQFTHSKVMAWVALDRGIEAVEDQGLEGEVDLWRKVRQEIHDTVCRDGFNARRGAFTQYFGSDRLDASLLMMPLVGFLPIDDPRVQGTVKAIREELMADGLVHRYHPDQSEDVDGLPPGEGTFLPCSFWMVDCLCRMGQVKEAEQLFERLLALRTPLGLLSEEYDLKAGRLVGNFPQIFSHVALLTSAWNLNEIRKKNGSAGKIGSRPKGD
jgi:pentatricopeptide repeat protein